MAIFIITQTFGQNAQLEGNWQGILIQPKGDSTENYAYWIEIHQTGDSIKGYARSELANTPFYAIIELNGVLLNDKITFFQTKIKVSNNRPKYTWCIIQGNLILNKIDYSLKGTWTSSTCGSGSILLYKSLKQLNMGTTLTTKYNNINQLEEKLKIKENIKGTKIVLSKVFFDVNKSTVSSISANELSEIVALLSKYQTLKVNIQGHTDNTGNDELNMKLSYNRAKEIYNYLLNNKIDISRLTYEGYGKSRPISSNKTETGKAKNRRVEIEIVQQ
ncbi:MAG: OmpA family protein [Bacteroidota bacterium]